MKTENLTSTLFFLAGVLFTTAAIAASPLEGDFQGQIRVGTNPVRNGFLHIREIQTGEKKRSLIAVLAAVGKNGQIGETLPFAFNLFFPGESPNQGAFQLTRLPTNAVGMQIVGLEVLVEPSGFLHGRLTSNMIAPDGSLIEANFDFKRTGNGETIPLS